MLNKKLIFYSLHDVFIYYKVYVPQHVRYMHSILKQITMQFLAWNPSILESFPKASEAVEH